MAHYFIFCFCLIGLVGCSSNTRENIRPEVTEISDEEQQAQQRVLNAIKELPRSEFITAELATANEIQDTTTSEAELAAFVQRITLAKISEGSKVLEIGTGDGYQAAILSKLGAHVYTIEIVPERAEVARGFFKNAGYAKIDVRTGDGWYGWPEHAPYDAILVSNTAPQVPLKLLSQLAHRGRLVLSLARENAEPRGMVFERDEKNIIARNVGTLGGNLLRGIARTIKTTPDSSASVPEQLRELLGTDVAPMSTGYESPVPK